MYDSGMNFGLGNEVDALRDTVRRFARDKVAPRAAAIDRTMNSRVTCGRSLAPSASSVSLRRRNMAVRRWVISPIAWPLRS